MDKVNPEFKCPLKNGGKTGGGVTLRIQHVGVIGGGNMGEAIIGAMIRSGLYNPSQIVVSDVGGERLETLHKAYGVNITDDNGALLAKCDVVIFAVKPQIIENMLSAMFTPDLVIDRRKVLISIAAGVPIHKLELLIYGHLDADARQLLPIIRVMPNTPALVLEGMSGMSLNAYVQPDDRLAARGILASMGSVLEFEEKDLDAVTALSGSGPAYVFYLAESMIDAGIQLGLDPGDSTVLTLKTLRGALKLMEESDESPDVLRKKVMSPGGTTEAAIAVMDVNDVKPNIVRAIAAAAERSRELSR